MHEYHEILSCHLDCKDGALLFFNGYTVPCETVALECKMQCLPLKKEKKPRNVAIVDRYLRQQNAFVCAGVAPGVVRSNPLK